MLINLYGNIVNPNSIVRVSDHDTASSYVIYFNADVQATTSGFVNFIEISTEKVLEIDGVNQFEPSLLYMRNMINKLEKRGIEAIKKGKPKNEK